MYRAPIFRAPTSRVRISEQSLLNRSQLDAANRSDRTRFLGAPVPNAILEQVWTPGMRAPRKREKSPPFTIFAVPTSPVEISARAI